MYLSDLHDALTPKTLSAALYMFFATFASTVALGELARQQTDGRVGVTEYLLLQVSMHSKRCGDIVDGPCLSELCKQKGCG
jgi:hypothetical protein